MDKIMVGTFNTKDNKVNRRGGIRDDGINNAEIVSDIIKENEFDFLGTQELTIKYVNELALRLQDYEFYGSYRYGNLLTAMPYNENNQIITNNNVVYDKTIWLPWVARNFPDLKDSITKMSIMPRVATIVISEDSEHRKVCMINTHLDYQVPSIQLRQLKALQKIVQKYGQDYEIILTGDFNMELGDKKFDSFVSSVDDKLKHVDIGSNTWHGNDSEKASIDHIFVPKNWQVENAGIIDSKGTSDHDVVFAEVRRR